MQNTKNYEFVTTAFLTKVKTNYELFKNKLDKLDQLYLIVINNKLTEEEKLIFCPKNIYGFDQALVYELNKAYKDGLELRIDEILEYYLIWLDRAQILLERNVHHYNTKAGRKLKEQIDTVIPVIITNGKTSIAKFDTFIEKIETFLDVQNSFSRKDYNQPIPS